MEGPDLSWSDEDLLTVSYGGYQGIRWDPKAKVFFGASESRKDGQAAGY